MTDEQIRGLGPAFSTYLRRFRPCFLQDRTAAHFDTFCRALLSPLPRKSVEPAALDGGTPARTLQMSLSDAVRDHGLARATLQRHVASLLPDLPPGGRLGNVGVIDETSCLEKGDKTPGVQRQYLGCVGRGETTASSPSTSASRAGGSRPFSTPTSSSPSRGTATASAAARQASPTASATAPSGGSPSTS